MDNSVKLSRDELLLLLYGTSYNIDGTIMKDTEVVRNYRIEVIDGKVHIKTYTTPIQILVDGTWKEINDVVCEEDMGLICDLFSEPHLDSEIILDTDDPTGISVRGRERVRKLPDLMTEAGVRLPREFTWVDGAAQISGVIVLPKDDYEKVFIATDPDKDGNPNILFIEPKKQQNQTRPYYEKSNGKTYIYVDHFSGGGGTQGEPYIVSNEVDLNAVRQNPGAYFIQDSDILMTKYQTGQGWNPIDNFSGYYDGRGYEIKDLFINREQDNVGLFGQQTGGIIKRVKLVNVNIKNTRSYTGGLVGRSNGDVYDCAVISGSVSGVNHTGGLIGYKEANKITSRCYSHAEVTSTGSNVGGLIGYHNGSENNLTQCLATGKVKDISVAQTGKNYGGLTGYGDCSKDNFFDITTGILVSSGNARGRTTADLKKISTFVSEGWNFSVYFLLDGKQNKGYPELRRFVRYSKGKGTSSDPYLIYTFEDLNQVRHYPWAHFRMENDVSIDMPATGQGFLGIGFGTGLGWNATEESFYGVFDGNGKTIGGLFQNRPTEDYQGLFKYFRGELKNLNVTDANVSGNGNTGAVLGYTDSKPDGSNATVVNVHVKSFAGSKVKGGSSYIGGFAGRPTKTNFTDCSFDGAVESGNNYVGGFFGTQGGNNNFTRCRTKGQVLCSGSYAGGFAGYLNYVAGRTNFYDILTQMEVTGNGFTGGFAGRLDTYTTSSNTVVYWLERVIAICGSPNTPLSNGLYGTFRVYYANQVQGKENYFDLQLAGTSNNGNSSGNTHTQGAPKYTAELKHPSTYTDSSWDMNNVWSLKESINEGYPELVFFIPPALPILGFRNKYGDYYTDSTGNLLRDLEYGTLVAGSTSDARAVWLQNNADFAVSHLKVWIDKSTVKPGISVELSHSNNPFVPVDEIMFSGTIPVGEARQFYVRFSSDVTVTEGGTFFLNAKASPVS
ncbi:halomucin [Bacillus licheniformis]|uniref:halomucin n=1 Tax=Bacillus TaxID=1386 RepID=UPI00227DE357|nr:MULTISPECIES: halomucin [Bacillus]MCY7861160.1 halomucin [Bacillus haynesii]MCY8549134.1 halomucin [Bacillus haynesii]MCY8745118.1 halomucin [Bacillus licheniformis]